MLTPILATKLYSPPSRAKAVPRPRLIERLNSGVAGKLTLISAPAGFGKTTLAGEWIANGKHPVVWLSLDEGDSDLSRFLTYFVTALQALETTMVSGLFGKGILSALQSSQPPPTEYLLTSLLNEISTIPDNFALVLDDYHLVDAKPVDDAIAFLLKHLPPQMHLVITTREDPNLPLARLRARNQLTELRASDLRFTVAEATDFLNQGMGLALSADDIATLETLTEGWIAGLQMAALSMQGQQDAARFIQSFTGSHRFILDYLVEEVLQRQDDQRRRFLLQTSILAKLSASLCDALTQQEDSQGTLETLERGNLFIVPLDDQRRWYRYHHLFADALQARLSQEQPDQLYILHKRASEWYEQHDSPAEAIHHVLASKDFERAASLIEVACRSLNGGYQNAKLLVWMKMLPDEIIRARPVLSVGYAWTLLSHCELEAAESRLRDAERWLNTTSDDLVHVSLVVAASSTEKVVVDQAAFQVLPASIATARAYKAQTLGDFLGSVKYAQQALSLLPEGCYEERSRPAALLGLAHWASGNLEESYRAFSSVIVNYQKVGNVVDTIDLGYALGEIRFSQGLLYESLRIYEQFLQLATAQEPPIRGTANLYVRIAEVYYEWGDSSAATQYLKASDAQGAQAAFPDWQYRWCIAQSRIKESQGDLEGAETLLNEAERLYYRSPVPNVCPVSALRARLWVKQGHLSKALGWIEQNSLAVDDKLSYLREFEHIILARVRIAQYQKGPETAPIKPTLQLLDRLFKVAKAGNRRRSLVEILVLQAMAHEAQGDISTALIALQQVLVLGEKSGFVHIFMNASNPVRALLLKAINQAPRSDYTNKLLAVLDAEQQQLRDSSSVVSSSQLSTDQLLIEPLSSRELEVLQLIADGLSNREISERLFVALSTVKGHNRRIFGKLQVKRRTECVVRARALGLL